MKKEKKGKPKSESKEKSLMKLAQDLDVSFSAAKIIYDKAFKDAWLIVLNLNSEKESRR